MQKRLMDYSAFDIIGPRMIGPSSSHTAGAARLAQVAGKIAGPDVAEVEFVLYGSFAQTGRGHGTDRALLAGVLGLGPDDERLRDSFALARERGLAFRFTNSQEEASHPNTVRIKARSRAGRRSEILGCSIGGGSILITQINGTEVEFTGEYPTVIIRYTDKPGMVAALSGILAGEGVNIAFMRVFRNSRGLGATMILETDQPISTELAGRLKKADSEIREVLVVD